MEKLRETLEPLLAARRISRMTAAQR